LQGHLQRTEHVTRQRVDPVEQNKRTGDVGSEARRQRPSQAGQEDDKETNPFGLMDAEDQASHVQPDTQQGHRQGDGGTPHVFKPRCLGGCLAPDQQENGE
jgi:hypothetical protein